jgi:hypothetical protein
MKRIIASIIFKKRQNCSEIAFCTYNAIPTQENQPITQSRESKHIPNSNIQLHVSNRECVLPVKMKQK